MNEFGMSGDDLEQMYQGVILKAPLQRLVTLDEIAQLSAT